jgi:hypothetical protein
MAPGGNSVAHQTLLQHLHRSASLRKPRRCLEPNRARANDGYAAAAEPRAHGPTSFGNKTKKLAVAAK